MIPSLLLAWHDPDEFMQMGSSNETLIFSLSAVLPVYELVIHYRPFANVDCILACEDLCRFDLNVASVALFLTSLCLWRWGGA